MRKIDKDYDVILSTRYKAWLDNLEADNSKHALSRTYYNDVAMELYKCQQSVCAYTERYICPNELYQCIILTQTSKQISIGYGQICL